MSSNLGKTRRPCHYQHHQQHHQQHYQQHHQQHHQLHEQNHRQQHNQHNVSMSEYVDRSVTMHTSRPRLTPRVQCTSKMTLRLTLNTGTWRPRVPDKSHSSTSKLPDYAKSKISRRAIVSSLKAYDIEPLTTLAILWWPLY